MTKRTKRYGGFRIGDRVRVKETRLSKFGEELLGGNVIQLKYGMVMVESLDRLNHVFRSWHSPTQLINLTRIEEDFDKFLNEGEIDIPLTEEDAKDIIAKKQQEYVKHFARKYFGDPLPTPYTRDVYTSTKDYFVS